MKTCEQLTADVLKRRDEYLEIRAVRRKQAKRYAAASLLVCAAAFAAAGLFRSGLLDDAPPVLLNDVTQSDRANASESASSHGNDLRLPEDGTGARETTVPHAVNTTETTTAIDLSGKSVYVFPSVTGPASAAPTEEPGTAPKREPERETTTRRQPPETTATQPDLPTTDPSGKVLPCPTRPEPTADNGNAGAEAPTALPTDEPATSEAVYYNVYVVCDGAVYAAENAVPTAVPAGAKTLVRKDGYLVAYDGSGSPLMGETDASFLVIADARIAASILCVENSAGAAAPSDRPDTEEPAGSETEPRSGPEEEWDPPGAEKITITLLALPSRDPAAQLGVIVPGIGEMLTLAYVGTEEELFATGGLS